MPQVGDGQLPERTVVAGQRDPAVQDARRPVRARDALQLDPSPGRRRGLADLVQELLRPPPQGDELDPQPVQLVELGIGRQLRVEDQLLGQAAGPLLPEFDEAEDLVVLLVLAQARRWRSRRLGCRRPGPKMPASPSAVGSAWRRSASRPARPRRERGSCGSRGRTMSPSCRPEPADRVEPAAHQLRVAGRRDAATVLGEERSLGDDVQAGEEGQPLVEDGAHDVAVAGVAEELQRQQRPDGTAGRDHLRAGETDCGQQLVEIGRDQHRARTGTGRRSWCGRTRGVRSSWRTSATSATAGRGRSGRSSSGRRGSLAKPSSLRIAATAAGLSDSPSRARARLMSWTERFCLRSATTCSRSAFAFRQDGPLGPWGRRSLAWADCGTDGPGPGSSRGVPETSSRLSRGETSTKNARRASYCR